MARAARGLRGSRMPRFWLMSDEARAADPLPLIAALPRGCGVVLRHYGCARRGEIAAAAAGLCRRRGLRFLVADDVGLAVRARADGVHLPQYRARAGLAMRRPRERWLVTASAHCPAALRRAAALGVDGVFLSPVFATLSHPGVEGIGALRARVWMRGVPRAHASAPAGMRVYALGGMSWARLRLLGAARTGGAATRIGCFGWAGSFPPTDAPSLLVRM